MTTFLTVFLLHGNREQGQSWQDFLKEYGLPSQVNADLAGGFFYAKNLSYADLRGASLTNAELGSANLRHANLAGADLTDANLDGAKLDHANLTGAKGLFGSFSETQQFAIDLLARIEKNPECLDMREWHTCETTHCIAGWAYPEEEAPASKASLTHPELTHLFYLSTADAIAGLKLVADGITTVKR